MVEEFSFEDLTFGGDGNGNSDGTGTRTTPQMPSAEDTPNNNKPTSNNAGSGWEWRNRGVNDAQLQNNYPSGSASYTEGHGFHLDGKDKKKSRFSPDNAEFVLLITRIFTDLNWEGLIDELAKGGMSVKRHSFREKQTFGFIMFDSQESSEKAFDLMKLHKLAGGNFTVEKTEKYTPFKDPRSSNIHDERNTTLVVKNLPFNISEKEVQELLDSLPRKCQHLSFHYDANRKFKGMAFIKYRSIDDSEMCFGILSGKDVGGRRLKVEYKKKVKGVGSPTAMMEGTRVTSHTLNLDLNDHFTRKWYDRMLIFKQNKTLDNLSFCDLSQDDFRIISTLASYFGFNGGMIDEEFSFLVISKKENKPEEGKWSDSGSRGYYQTSQQLAGSWSGQKYGRDSLQYMLPRRQPVGPIPGSKGFTAGRGKTSAMSIEN